MANEIHHDIAHCLIRCFEGLCSLFEERTEPFQLIGGAQRRIEQIQEIGRRQAKALRIEHVILEPPRGMHEGWRWLEAWRVRPGTGTKQDDEGGRGNGWKSGCTHGSDSLWEAVCVKNS